ncbi:hypothetical protein [Peribacillus frigoritolerans]|uniref:hypothetical protein n=1 Tax=Peribacillus frigoritolerans TaxID=450367 RepID=UPI0014050DCF|nr:hypothetical protein [Peribacillus frigoritolerans]
MTSEKKQRFNIKSVSYTHDETSTDLWIAAYVEAIKAVKYDQFLKSKEPNLKDD